MDQESASGINKVVPRDKLYIPTCRSNKIYTRVVCESCTGLEESILKD